jgi:hypothetical protein
MQDMVKESDAGFAAAVAIAIAAAFITIEPKWDDRTNNMVVRHKNKLKE